MSAGAPATVAVEVDLHTLTRRDLGGPPPLPARALRIMPLGGLGAIGRNMTVFEYQGRLLVVDCGVLFPDSDQPGVDLILPDFGYLEDRLDQVEAVVPPHPPQDPIRGGSPPPPAGPPPPPGPAPASPP